MARRQWNRRQISDRVIRSRPRVSWPTKRRRGEASLLVLGCEAERGELRNGLKRKALWLAKGDVRPVGDEHAPPVPLPLGGGRGLQLRGGPPRQGAQDARGEAAAG